MKMVCSSGRTRDFALRHPVRPALEVVSGRFGTPRTHLSRRSPAFSEKFRHPAQVDGGHGHSENQRSAVEATQLQLPQGAVLLAVAEDGFDQLANNLTHRVAGMARGALIDRASAVLGVLGDMRRHPDGAAVGDEVGGVIAFICTYRLA